MTLEDLGNLGELIAAIATIGTLLYLAAQIRQNNSAVRLSAGQTILISLNDAIQMASSSPDTARVMIHGQSSFDSLSPNEQAQYIMWIFAWFRVLEQAHFYYEQGLLDEQVWSGQVSHLTQITKSPTTMSWWSMRKGFFNQRFQNLVDDLSKTETDMSLPGDVLPTLTKSSES